MLSQKPGLGSSSRWTLAFGHTTGLGGARPEALSRPPDASSAGRPASILAGRYRIERLVGEGAHKRVYLGWDSRLDRRVALAVIKTEGLSEGLAERVRREARTMARLPGHANLVTVYDAGEAAGRPYIVQEYLDGGTVADLLEQAQGRALAVQQALRIGAGVCAALEHIHRHAIVHRDLKPENVWLAADGTPKLGDFGLQTTLREVCSATMAKLTAEGVMVGTIAYMPPEQALGNAVSPQADLYSLGAVLYEMVTGTAPFVGDDVLAILAQHIVALPMAPVRRNPAVPAALNDLILALLAKDPRRRPDGARAVRAALDALGTAPAPGRGRVSGWSKGDIDDLCAAADSADFELIGSDRRLVGLRATAACTESTEHLVALL